METEITSEDTSVFSLFIEKNVVSYRNTCDL